LTGGEKKEDQIGVLTSKKRHSGEVSGIFFSSCIPYWLLKNLAQHRDPTGHRSKKERKKERKPNKRLPTLVK
jgi:hypothetical protein